MEQDLSTTRRHFFKSSALSLAPMAVASLLHSELSGAEETLSGPLPAVQPHFPARAKSVIFLAQVGGPSQIDLFDPKPALKRFEGQPLPESIMKQLTFAQIQEKQPKLMSSPWKFRRYGESGADVSELMPRTAGIVDHLTFLRTVKTDDTNHMFAELMMNTGWRQFGRPSLGSWVVYGLGSESQNLPAFMVLGTKPRSKSANYDNGFLPSKYQGTRLRESGAPILNLSSPSGFSQRQQRESIDTINALNRFRLQQTGDQEIAARIASYELAFRMQTAAPELLELKSESAGTLKLYGVNDLLRPSYARNCLIARRLVERGVRFVQVFNGDWDHHSNIRHGLPSMSQRADQPSAALIQDLSQRGLLDETLVIWGGELGRTPVAQKSDKPNVPLGRDHQIEAFTMWLAGGGATPGQTIGRTNDLGCLPASESLHVYDLQATILHLLGLDHKRLTYRTQGRDFRLTDVYGKVKTELFS